MKTRILALASLLLCASAFAADRANLDITRETVLAQMNAYRIDLGLSPLREDPRLSLAAEDRMRDMEDLGYWAHQSPDGRSPFLWLAKRSYAFSYAGENLARGFETPEVLVASWMDSDGHRANIMSPLFQDCGVAIIDGAVTGRATGKSVVVIFARQKSE
ncbi:MAG TPA: CAP domain-containing protein [Thermoanaerobaculia bacterium]|nr:CAP domain-containing protein [Thermoanaerobaculia bacterium]